MRGRPAQPPSCSWARPPPRAAQFVPYFGKNKVTYDSFAWRVYKSPHFEVYYYPEFEQHLARVVSYAESAYQKVSSDLKHEIRLPIPLILYKTHSEFEQTNLYPDFVPEGVLAFAEPVRGRMVLPIDEPPDKLQGLITHELTHIFEFDLIPRNLVQRSVPAVGGRGAGRLHARDLGHPRPHDHPGRRGDRPGPPALAASRTTAASRTRASSTTSATRPSSSSRPASARRASASSSTPSARTSWGAGWTRSTSRPSA